MNAAARLFAVPSRFQNGDTPFVIRTRADAEVVTGR